MRSLTILTICFLLQLGAHLPAQQPDTALAAQWIAKGKKQARARTWDSMLYCGLEADKILSQYPQQDDSPGDA